MNWAGLFLILKVERIAFVLKIPECSFYGKLTPFFLSLLIGQVHLSGGIFQFYSNCNRTL